MIYSLGSESSVPYPKHTRSAIDLEPAYEISRRHELPPDYIQQRGDPVTNNPASDIIAAQKKKDSQRVRDDLRYFGGGLQGGHCLRAFLIFHALPTFLVFLFFFFFLSRPVAYATISLLLLQSLLEFGERDSIVLLMAREQATRPS